MTRKISSTVRYMFSSIAITALMYAGLETATAGTGPIGTPSCGKLSNPCRLTPVVATVPGVKVVKEAHEASSVSLTTQTARIRLVRS
jgi:hypothetical protein